MDDVNILILGAGKVAHPIVNYLLNSRYEVTVASEHLYQSEYLIQNHPLGKAVEWHAGDHNKLNSLVAQHEIVVSLLPFHLHIDVCRACISQKKDLITTSYQQPGMAELHSEACKSNITILNEMGLDPGIDHMWASQMIDAVKVKGGKVEKFISVCGALPVPESLDNPFRYKFSWSPLGVIKASTSPAVFLKKGETIQYKSSDLMRNTFSVDMGHIGHLEAYANRDSMKYIDLYQVPEVTTFFRGTFRYAGWCETMATLIDAGYFSEDDLPEDIQTYAELTSYLTKIKMNGNMRDKLAQKLNIATHSNSILAMEWLGLFSNVHYNRNLKNSLNVLTNRMVGKMKMLPSDKDLVVLHHQLLYSLPDHSKKLVKGTLVLTGQDSENTAIAKSVSYPAALAVELLLDKKIAHKGMVRPLYKEIYDPVLHQLKNKLNFNFSETEADVDEWPVGW